MSKYKNNFNPIFINNYFKQLNNLFDKDDLKLKNKLDLIYNDYLNNYNKDIYNKYYNGLLYCCNYIISLRQYYIKTHPNEHSFSNSDDNIYFTSNKFIEFVNLSKSIIINRYNDHILNKGIMNLIIKVYLKVNYFYNYFLKHNLFN